MSAKVSILAIVSTDFIDSESKNSCATFCFSELPLISATSFILVNVLWIKSALFLSSELDNLPSKVSAFKFNSLALLVFKRALKVS